MEYESETGDAHAVPTRDEKVEAAGGEFEPANAATTRVFDGSRKAGAFALALFAALTCFIGLRHGPSMGDHECINALAARQLLESGDWLIPHVSEVPWIRKPPLGTWLIAAASCLVDGPNASPPVSDFAARLPSAVAAWGTVLVVYWLGRRMYGERAGLTSGFVAAGCVGIIFYARSAQVDMVLTFFTTLALACFWRGAVDSTPSRWAMTAFYAAFALAMMSKAPLPLVSVGLALAIYWLVTVPLVDVGEARPRSLSGFARLFGRHMWEQLKKVRTLWVVPGVLLFLVLAGAWPVYVYEHFDRAIALWRVEYFDRFTGEMSDRAKPLLYYVPIILALTAPFLMSLPEAVAAPFLRRYRPQRKGMTFAFTCAIVGTCFLSASVMKRPHYPLSLIPMYCLLLGPVIDRLFFGSIQVVGRGVQVLGRVIPVLLALGAIGGGVVLRRKFPSLFPYYIGGIVPAALLWTAACWAFVRSRRTLSFALLNLGILASLVAVTLGAGSFDMNPQANALVEGLRANHVEPDDPIFWVDGRPDSSVEFYSGYRIRRLINEIEITNFRDTRSALPGDLYQEYARRIRDQLAAPRPVYLVLSPKYLDMLKKNIDIDLQVVFQLRESHENGLVVVTHRNVARRIKEPHAAAIKTSMLDPGRLPERGNR